ncbi:MAG: hypothetical protein H7343_13850 [Undibacterium sp.]|nr:hypothetical protein [Opitutaceae bacterium]
MPAWLVFDPDRLRQVLLNLVGNAIKLTLEGGVVVNLRLVTADANEALVEIAVVDTGPGIAPADQARLFRPFTRIEATLHHEGAGLDLAIAHGLCVGVGGPLTVESDGRTGTTFRARLTLPLGAPPPAVGDPVVTPVKAHAGVTIVVADDNTLVRELYLAHFISEGATGLAAADGAAAVTTVLAAQPPPMCSCSTWPCRSSTASPSPAASGPRARPDCASSARAPMAIPSTVSAPSPPVGMISS